MYSIMKTVYIRNHNSKETHVLADVARREIKKKNQKTPKWYLGMVRASVIAPNSVVQAILDDSADVWDWVDSEGYEAIPDKLP